MSPLRELLRRRVPHVLGAWIGLTWGLTQFFGFLSDRYGLDGVFIDVVLLAGLFLVPGVAWCAWRIGADGPVQWRRRDGVLLAGNVALAAVAMASILLIAGSNPAVVDQTATVTDGDDAAAALAAPQRRSGPTLMVAPFQGEAGVEQAVLDEYSLLLALDLQQDTGLRIHSPYLRAEVFTELARGSDPLHPPFGLLAEVARLLGASHLVTGRVAASSEPGYEVELTLYELRPAREHQRFTVVGAEPTVLVDQLSAQLREVLGNRNQVQEDLPVTALSSEDARARALFTRAMVARYLRRDTLAADDLLQQALARDDGFALAHLRLAELQMAQGRWPDAVESLTRADQRSWSLTRETRAGLRVAAEKARQPPDPRAVNRAYAQWIEQFPGSAAPRIGLLRRQMFDDQPVQASLEEVAAILAVAEQAREFLELIDILLALDDRPRALAVAAQGVEQFPESRALKLKWATLLGEEGRHDEADEVLAGLIVEQPNLNSALVQMAQMQADLGQDEGARYWFQRALDSAWDDAQRYSVLAARIGYLQEIGRTDEALADLARLETLTGLQSLAPLERAQRLWPLSGLLALRDGRDLTLGRFSNLAEDSNPFYLGWSSEVLPFLIDLTMRDVDAMRESLPVVEAWLSGQTQQHQLEVSVLFGRLLLWAAAGEAEAAYGALVDRLDALEWEVRTLRLPPLYRDHVRDLRAGVALVGRRWSEAADQLEPRRRSKPGRMATLLYQAELEFGLGDQEAARLTLGRIDQVLLDASPESPIVKQRNELRQRMAGLEAVESVSG